MEKKNIFYERLLIEIEQTAKSVNQIERELGYPRNALHNYKNVKNPSIERVMQLAQYFGVPFEYLVGEVQEVKLPSPYVLFQKFDTRQKFEMSILCQTWERKILEELIKEKEK